MSDPCARCGAAEASPILWPLCEPCWQEQCNEEHEALCNYDAVGRLMWIEGLSFVDAVERLAAQRRDDR
jgi:hypothetical protein